MQSIHWARGTRGDLWRRRRVGVRQCRQDPEQQAGRCRAGARGWVMAFWGLQ